MEPLLLEPKKHPLGYHRLRVPNPKAMNPIFFIPRTGVRCSSLDADGRHRLVLDLHGCNDDQSSPCGVEKTGSNPTDRGRQGVEPSLLSEAKGIPLSVIIDGANRHEMKLVLRKPWHRLRLTVHRWRGEQARAIRQGAGFRARGWVVKRTHGWMNRFRRILVRWEKLAGTYPAMLHLACALITWRAVGLAK